MIPKMTLWVKNTRPFLPNPSIFRRSSCLTKIPTNATTPKARGSEVRNAAIAFSAMPRILWVALMTRPTVPGVRYSFKGTTAEAVVGSVPVWSPLTKTKRDYAGHIILTEHHGVSTAFDPKLLPFLEAPSIIEDWVILDSSHGLSDLTSCDLCAGGRDCESYNISEQLEDNLAVRFPVYPPRELVGSKCSPSVP
ncbi:hypothetical protein BCR34DRAFT_560172 [Clohesyomyces aquaticus]|uniref:Uncharacterized protein n=1 Tax=Clohesyomyces aquaticus TaxID=1231657 RepID=A0A1Y1ZXM9_9PLEO|nr:hypothetical protein BCR34DRAFT_560172 [Clohesyomyces aquaticus]